MMAGNIVVAGLHVLNVSAEKMEKKHPIFGMLLFQIAVGIGLIGTVAGIATLGGAVIWLFYHAMGVM